MKNKIINCLKENKMNKNGASLKYMLLSIIAFGIIISAVTVNISKWDEAYGSGINNDLGQYDESSTIKTFASDSQELLSPQSANTGEDTETRTYKGVFGIITTIFNPLGVVSGENGIIDKLGKNFQIPTYFIIGIISMFSIVIVFEIIKIIFRYSGRNI